MDYSSVFTPGSFTTSSFDTSDQGLGANNGMAFPFLAAGALGSSLLSGIFGGQAADRQAQGMAAAANAQYQAARDASFASLLGGQWAATGAKEWDQLMQKNAANYQQSFLDPKKIELATEANRAAWGDQLSGPAQQLRRQKNIDELYNSLAQRTATTDAMFGPIQRSPFSYGGVVGAQAIQYPNKVKYT